MSAHQDIVENGYKFLFLTKEEQTRDMALMAISNSPELYCMLPLHLRDDMEIAHKAISGNGSMWSFLSKEQKQDLSFLFDATETFPFALYNAYNDGYITDVVDIAMAISIVSQSKGYDQAVIRLIDMLKRIYGEELLQILESGAATKPAK